MTLGSWAEILSALLAATAVLITVATLRVEQSNRRRDEVKGVQCWVEHGGTTKSGPSVVVRNSSNEPCYDVHYSLRPVAIAGIEVILHAETIAPGASLTKTFPATRGSSQISPAWIFQPIGVIMSFRDSSDARWGRDRNGRLTRIRPVRPWTPWRYHHEFDRSSASWWAFRTHWHYRWRDFPSRDVDRLPPAWWAIDMRWERWRYAVEHDPIRVHPSALRILMRNQFAVARFRVQNNLPVPWWMLRVRTQLWQEWRHVRRRHRASDRDLNRTTRQIERQRRRSY